MRGGLMPPFFFARHFFRSFQSGARESAEIRHASVIASGKFYRSVQLPSSGHSKSWFLRNNRPFFPSLVRVTGVSFGRLTTTDNN